MVPTVIDTDTAISVVNGQVVGHDLQRCNDAGTAQLLAANETVPHLAATPWMTVEWRDDVSTLKLAVIHMVVHPVIAGCDWRHRGCLSPFRFHVPSFIRRRDAVSRFIHLFYFHVADPSH